MEEKLELFRIYNPKEFSSYAFIVAKDAIAAIKKYAEKSCIEHLIDPQCPIRIGVRDPISEEFTTLFSVESITEAHRLCNDGYEIHITPLEQKASEPRDENPLSRFRFNDEIHP